MIQDSGAKIILTVSKHARDLREHTKSDVLTLDNAGLLTEMSGGPVALARAVKPEDVCYCLYTSGSPPALIPHTF